MHPRVTATLKQLEGANWFSNVGRHDTAGAIVLDSWQEAIEHSESIDWGNLQLEAQNQYCERLVERSFERFQRWNEHVREIKLVTAPLVSRKIEQVVAENKLPPGFKTTVHRDILGVCMEAEYADVYPPGFFASQAYWYVKGHFPCGWRGDFPAGTLIIF